MSTCVYRTADFRKIWTRIVAPEQGVRGYAHVVREDLVRKDLLFVGTELGLWISVDGGRSWAEFKRSDFPAVAVRYLKFQATHGVQWSTILGRGHCSIHD